MPKSNLEKSIQYHKEMMEKLESKLKEKGQSMGRYKISVKEKSLRKKKEEIIKLRKEIKELQVQYNIQPNLKKRPYVQSSINDAILSLIESSNNFSYQEIYKKLESENLVKNITTTRTNIHRILALLMKRKDIYRISRGVYAKTSKQEVAA